jgi:parallel beta-helix repeat protein
MANFVANSSFWFQDRNFRANVTIVEDTDAAYLAVPHLFSPYLGNASVSSAMIQDGTITNSDVSGSAAIAFSKLEPAFARVTNLKGFAVGDGLADDSSAIDAVMASALSGDVVFAPAGTYLTDNFSVPAGVTLRGSRDAVFKLKTGANTTLVTLGAGSVLEGVTVDGNRAGQGSGGNGVSLSGAGAVVRDCAVQHCYGYGILSANKDAVVISDNTVSDTRLQGIFVEASSVAIERIRITNNTVDRSAEGTGVVGTGMTLKGTASFKASRCLISGNDVAMPTGAVPAGAICIETFGGVDRCRVVGNETSGGSMGISLDNTIQSVCGDNTVFNMKSNGIELASSSQCAVTGNTIDGNGVTTNGINLSNTTPRKNAVTGNNITGCVTRGILANDADGSTFSANVINMPSNYAIEVIATIVFTVDGNSLSGNGTATKGIAINTSDHGSVTGNSVNNFTEHGILLYAASAVTMDRLTIMANMLYGNNVPFGQSLSGGAVLGNLNTFIGNTAYGGTTHRIDVLDVKNNIVVVTGAGSPESVIAGGIGSIYHRRDGGALTSTYFKETGTGNTGWVAK